MKLWQHPRLAGALCALAVLVCAAAPAVFLAAADAAALGRTAAVQDPYTAPVPSGDDYYLLYMTGSLDRMGRTADGNTVMDYDEQEIAKKISISLAVAYTVWRDTKINLIDVPGFYDFEGEAEEAMRAACPAGVAQGQSLPK